MIKGAKTIPVITIRIPARDKKQKKEKANETAFDLPSFSSVSENTGTNETLNIPSEKSFRARSKGRKAIKKASLWDVVPKYMAMTASLIIPRTRLLKVKRVNKTAFFNILTTSFP